MPRRTFNNASSAINSGLIEFKRQPLFWAQPEELLPMITVDASIRVDRCSANTPFVFATPIVKDEVVSDPAATHPALAALRQITATRVARVSGSHTATSRSKEEIEGVACGTERPLNSGLSG